MSEGRNVLMWYKILPETPQLVRFHYNAEFDSSLTLGTKLRDARNHVFMRYGNDVGICINLDRSGGTTQYQVNMSEITGSLDPALEDFIAKAGIPDRILSDSDLVVARRVLRKFERFFVDIFHLLTIEF